MIRKIVILLSIFIFQNSFSKNITLNLKDADIKNVFRLLGEYGNINIVVDSNVKGEISVILKDIDFEDALKIIADTNGLEYERKENFIIVKYKRTETKIFKLKYVNANDIKKVISQFLSPIGKIEVLSETILGGWQSAGIGETSQQFGQKTRISPSVSEKPNILIVEDIKENLNKIEDLIKIIDIPKNKIKVEVMFIEMNSEDVRNLGIKWYYQQSGYGSTGGTRIELETGDISPPEPGFTGLKVGYSDLTGTQLFAQIQALQKEGRANIISNPRVIVIEEHQANILVGEKYPILKTDVVPGTTPPTFIESFSHYEPVGINLLVIPKVIEPDIINLIIHPEVSSLGEDVVGSTGLRIKRINTREIDTQINVKDGNIIVIGGLISKKKQKSIYKVPLLGDIPVLGKLFQREDKNDVDIELLIFIQPTIIKEETSEKEIYEKMKKF